jgi:hypothetical protein
MIGALSAFACEVTPPVLTRPSSRQARYLSAQHVVGAVTVDGWYGECRERMKVL